MPSVYIDTGLFVALAFTDDDFHTRAKEITLGLIKGTHGKPIQTSSAVIIETAAIIHRKSSGRGKNQRACDKVNKIFDLIERYNFEINHLTPELLEKANELYTERRGVLDFVDSINMAFLRNNNVKKIVSFDSHFDQFSGEGITRIS